MPDERPPRLGWSLLKRSALAGVLIVVLAAAATATAGLEKVATVAHEVFTQHIGVSKGVIVPSYDGQPATFLLIGSDRRKGSKDNFDRLNPPHSDTLLLVRLDPQQGQTSVLSIPRDLLVKITEPNGAVHYPEKVNAAYTIGGYEHGHDPGANLAALTVENLLGIKLSGIIDVTFGGFINVVDSLGCVYVNVDHRYFNVNTGTTASNYSSINLKPGYQKLCYTDALDYVRYRHTDSDFTRVARQQDFIRNLREQVSASNLLNQIDTVSRNVGKAVTTSFPASVSETLQLAKLVAFSQQRALRQVKFRYSADNAMINGVAYVVATPQNISDTVHDFLYGREQPQLPAAPAPARSSRRGRHASGASGTPGMVPTASADMNQAISAATGVPFRVLYPSLQTSAAVPQGVRAYRLRDAQNRLHNAFVEVWQQNIQGGYYDVEGTNWLDPPIIAHPQKEQTIGGRRYIFVNDGSRVHLIAWRENGALYWVNNTLREDLSNRQMLALAESVAPLH
jgi:LCP family protein required for cell wall assembly